MVSGTSSSNAGTDTVASWHKKVRIGGQVMLERCDAVPECDRIAVSKGERGNRRVIHGGWGQRQLARWSFKTLPEADNDTCHGM